MKMSPAASTGGESARNGIVRTYPNVRGKAKRKPDSCEGNRAYKKRYTLFASNALKSGFGCGVGDYADESAVKFPGLEGDNAIGECVDGKVFAHADIATRVEFGATLADDDIACCGGLSSEEFHPKAFAFTIAAVITTTYTFLMCHDFSVLYCVI
jgi:hypothetical protein